MRFTVVGCLAIILWASSIPFAKRCIEDVGPLTLPALQYLVGAALGITVNFFSGKLKKSELGFFKRRQFYFRTALFALYMCLFYFAIGAVERANLPIVTLLNYLWPTLTMILSVILLKQHFNPPLLLLGSVLVIAGLTLEILGGGVIGMLTQPHSASSLAAFASVTLAACSWAVYTVLNRKWGVTAGGVTALPFVMLFSAFWICSLRFAFAETSRFPPEVYLPLAYMLLIPYVANVCWDVGTRRGSITFLSLLADCLPWASLTISSLYLDIPIGSETWISAVLIVAGALISRVSLLRGGGVSPAASKEHSTDTNSVKLS